MTLNKEEYHIHRKIIRTWLDNKPDADLSKEISYISLATNCPLIIVLEFIMEIKGRSSNLVELQERLMTFYKISEVV